MSTGNAPRDDGDLADFLARKSSVSADYDKLEPVEPAARLDAQILAAAKAAVRLVEKAAPAGSAAPPNPRASPLKGTPARTSARAPEPVADDDDAEDVDEAPVARRPRWMVPVALAASVLVAVGVGFAVLDFSPPADSSSSAREEKSGLALLFAKRARARSEAEKAAAEAAAAAEAEVMVMEAQPPPPPPPFFEFDGPQVADLDAAIAMIRRELIIAGQREAMEEAPSATALADSGAEPVARSAAPAQVGPTSVIQSRNRRLAKVLELYDTGSPFLAEDALEIFLRDFADDPISQRILGIKP